ncbi:MAG: hypothetical protein R2712_06600 [Vicinamibacterales bacterium]
MRRNIAAAGFVPAAAALPHETARHGRGVILNLKPLRCAGTERRPDLFTVPFDVPSICATLLHDGEVDLGLIPAIQYCAATTRWFPAWRSGPTDPCDRWRILPGADRTGAIDRARHQFTHLR